MKSLTEPKLCRVRAITFFIVLNEDSNKWEQVICETAEKCSDLANMIAELGYEVQSIRMVTNPFGEYLDTSSLETAMAGMEKLKATLESPNMPDIRIRFAIGEARNESELKLLPEMIKQYGDICNTCVNVGVDESGLLDNKLILSSVDTIKDIGEITPNGEGNFNFTVNFNCPSFIPYFPAGYHRGENGECFMLGFETPDLLVAAVEEVNEKNISSHQEYRKAAFTSMKDALQHHTDKLVSVAHDFSDKQNVKFIGIDSSAAPSKDCSSMVDVYQLLGVENFGAAGTLETSALLTRVFKSIENVELVGFSGLMLAVTEDSGLAEGTIQDNFDIRTLLMNSAVCGIGLDTVPIPGNTSIEKIAAIMRDTGTLAFRLNKPLTVRLFPVPGLESGQKTNFESDDLCNCSVLEIK